MFKKTRYLFVIFLLAVLTVNGQQEKGKLVCCCSNIINQLSEGWKKDSLANNDYRITNVKFLKTCKLDSVTIEFLLEKFGKPFSVIKTNHGIEYVYLYYDFRTKPKGFDGPFAAEGIVFYSLTGEKIISSIDNSDMDL